MTAPAMPPYLPDADPTTEPGYYLRPDGVIQYWTGQTWITPRTAQPAPPPPVAPLVPYRPPPPMPAQPWFPSTSVTYVPLHRRRGLNMWMGILTMGMWNLVIQLPCAIVYGISGREAVTRHR